MFTYPLANYMQKALSLFEKRPLASVAGKDLDPRPLGYETYDALFLVSCVPARLDDLPGRRTAVAGLACRLPRLAQSRERIR